MGKFKDLTGLKIGKLLILSRSSNDKNGKVQWNCLCDCGRKVIIRTGTILNRHQCFCGKCKNDLVGKRFGRLLVLKETDEYTSYSYSKKRYLCQCDCGKQIKVKEALLLNGHTSSCGCLHKDLLTKRLTTHGESKTRLYKIWSGMKRRCLDDKNKSFSNYGKRGITICKEWLNFKLFSEWAKENGYNDSLTIERIDVNGNYCPNNCCWIPNTEQAKNRRTTCLLEIDGEKESLTSWCKKLHISFSRKKQDFVGTCLEKPYKLWLEEHKK